MTATRVCFVLPLRPNRVDDYLRAHETVWPEMLDALRVAGWRDYSLFIDRDRALVIGHLIADDFGAAQAAMAASEVNARWQESMAGYFASDGAPDDGIRALDEYFHLD